MPLLNYTTKIDADKTTQEISRTLSRAGAVKIMTDYEDGVISAVSFGLKVNDQLLGFRLPCDWRPVYVVLQAQLARPKLSEWSSDKEKARHEHRLSELRLQAVRTAWRIVKVWIDAQCALIETSMVKTEEVFLPYMITKSGETIYQQIANNQFRLGDGK
jgi:hypothetical protein